MIIFLIESDVTSGLYFQREFDEQEETLGKANEEQQPPPEELDLSDDLDMGEGKEEDEGDAQQEGEHLSQHEGVHHSTQRWITGIF